MHWHKSKSGLIIPRKQAGLIHPGMLSGGLHRPFPMEKVEYTLNTSTGNQDITLDPSIGKGKTPIAAMFVLSRNSDGVGEVSVGFFDGTSSIVIAISSANGATTTNTGTWGATDECLMRLNVGGSSVNSEAAGASLIPNGVRINIGAASAALPGTCYLFFDDDGAAKVDTFTSHATQDSSVTVTPGIAADAVISVFPKDNANWFDDTAHDDARMSLGFCVSGGNQCSLARLDNDGSSTTSVQHRINATGAAKGGIGPVNLEYGNFTATQFDATTRGNPAGGVCGYLALEMPNAQFWAGIIDTPTSISEASYTSPNFPVQSLLSAPSISETVGLSTDRTAECFGVAAATKRGVSSVTVASEDNVGTADTESHYNSSTIRAAGADDHNESEANSFTTIPTGFKLNFTTAHSTAQKWPVLAIGRA